MKINPPTDLKRIQFLGSPFRGKHRVEYRKCLLEEKLKRIRQEYPLIPHVRASRLYSTVRRMKVEKEMDIPINLRAGFVISVKTSKRANEMTNKEWEDFYGDLCEELKRDYPEMHVQMFP